MSIVMLDEPLVQRSESAQVEAWRYSELLAAGYHDQLALALALRHDVDLHQAVELVSRRGCPPELAVQILT